MDSDRLLDAVHKTATTPSVLSSELSSRFLMSFLLQMAGICTRRSLHVKFFCLPNVTVLISAALVLGTSPLRPAKYPGLPPFIQRFGFGLIFAGAGSIIQTGDIENGNGVATGGLTLVAKDVMVH
jgi:hypothetical protein